MDCEKFETSMIDELYDELDELTSAAAKRHVAGCARCAALLGGLRATRRVVSTAGGIPMVEPPANLEERILAAAREAQKVVPFQRRIANAVSTAGSWAMRPQTAMAAVFLLMIGSSVVFLRGGRQASKMNESAPMTVTERGAPAASLAALPRAESLDTLEAKAAHGAAKKAAPEPASSPIAMGTAAPAPADETNKAQTKGLLDGVAQSGAGDKGGALAQLDDSDGEKRKQDDAWGRRAGPSNAGAVGGAAGYRASSGGGQASNAYNAPPAARPAAAPPAKPVAPLMVAEAAENPPATPVTPAPMATLALGKDKKEAERDQATTAFDSARAQLAQKNYAEATRQFDALAENGDGTAAVWAARSVREGSGCGAALSRYDMIAGRQAGSNNGNDALLEGGQCYRQLGQSEAARARLVRLLTVPSHAARAQRELDAMSPKATAKPQPRKAPEPSQQKAVDSAF